MLQTVQVLSSHQEIWKKKKEKENRRNQLQIPGAATLQLVNMSIHLFKINVLLISVYTQFHFKGDKKIIINK